MLRIADRRSAHVKPSSAIAFAVTRAGKADLHNLFCCALFGKGGLCNYQRMRTQMHSPPAIVGF
jgi:hypothetical protein